MDRIAELISGGGLFLHEAVDWVVLEEIERYTPSQWAAVRNVTEDTVRSDVSAARERLLADDDDNSSVSIEQLHDFNQHSSPTNSRMLVNSV